MKISKKSLINSFEWRNDGEFRNILGDNTDNFFEWFRLNSEKYRFNKDIENFELPDDYKPELGSCFKNSQYYHFFHEYDYYEGFTALISGDIQFIIHAFNVKNQNLADFTYYSNIEKVRKWLGSLPDFHVGIKIPPDIMVEVFNRLGIDHDETRTSNSLSISLLIPYYIINSGLDWDITSYASPIEQTI